MTPSSVTGVSAKDRAVEGILWHIGENRLAGGDRLPAERDFCQRLGVSRTALRGAIAELEGAHVLESIHGSGVYVMPRRPMSIFQETYGFSDIVRRAGMTPGSRVVNSDVIAVGTYLADKLHVRPDERALELRRVRLADDEPVSFESVYVNMGICPGIDSHDFATESLYDVLGEEYGVTVGHGSIRISITRTDPDVSRLLGVAEGTPAFFERGLMTEGDGTPIEYFQSSVLPARLKYASDEGVKGSRVEVGNEWLTG